LMRSASVGCATKFINAMNIAAHPPNVPGGR
jgi:hypothetical protein